MNDPTQTTHSVPSLFPHYIACCTLLRFGFTLCTWVEKGDREERDRERASGKGYHLRHGTNLKGHP